MRCAFKRTFVLQSAYAVSIYYVCYVGADFFPHDSDDEDVIMKDQHSQLTGSDVPFRYHGQLPLHRTEDQQDSHSECKGVHSSSKIHSSSRQIQMMEANDAALDLVVKSTPPAPSCTSGTSHKFPDYCYTGLSPLQLPTQSTRIPSDYTQNPPYHDYPSSCMTGRSPQELPSAAPPIPDYSDFPSYCITGLSPLRLPASSHTAAAVSGSEPLPKRRKLLFNNSDDSNATVHCDTETWSACTHSEIDSVMMDDNGSAMIDSDTEERIENDSSDDYCHSHASGSADRYILVVQATQSSTVTMIIIIDGHIMDLLCNTHGQVWYCLSYYIWTMAAMITCPFALNQKDGGHPGALVSQRRVALIIQHTQSSWSSWNRYRNNIWNNCSGMDRTQHGSIRLKPHTHWLAVPVSHLSVLQLNLFLHPTPYSDLTVNRYLILTVPSLSHRMHVWTA